MKGWLKLLTTLTDSYTPRTEGTVLSLEFLYAGKQHEVLVLE